MKFIDSKRSTLKNNFNLLVIVCHNIRSNLQHIFINRDGLGVRGGETAKLISQTVFVMIHDDSVKV
jgi:hypothetical protein